MKKRKWKKSDTIGWLVMLPTLVLFTFFVWEPLLENIRISLYSAKGYELLEFVGLKNYIKVIQAPKFFQVVKNTFSYTLWSLVIGFIVPIIMGILISETTHFITFRTQEIWVTTTVSVAKTLSHLT